MQENEKDYFQKITEEKLKKCPGAKEIYNYLRKIGISEKGINFYPSLLETKIEILEERYKTLEEIGISNIASQYPALLTKDSKTIKKSYEIVVSLGLEKKIASNPFLLLLFE